tara:strand:+ start:445 stop:1059 length:615 start_codon:yes stop_codon:yes gene_type:complete
MAQKVVIFDLGNVLINFNHDLIFEGLSQSIGQSSDEVRNFFVRNNLWIDWDKGLVTSSHVFNRFKEWSGCNLIQSDFNQYVCDIFSPNYEAVEMSKKLKDFGHRLVLLSNTNASHFEWITSKYNILEHFDKLMLSFEVGLIKPDPRIFQLTLDVVKCVPENCFFIDDLVDNVEAAKLLGIRSHQFNGIEGLSDFLAGQGLISGE